MQACHLARIYDIYYYYSQLLSQIFIVYFFDYLFTVSLISCQLTTAWVHHRILSPDTG